jgi:hypothetical protein
MPRLSLYRPQKGNDYKFIDKTIWEMFQVGGTDVLVHKYLGPGSTEPWNSTTNYTVGTVVSINNSLYKCIKTNTNIAPPNSEYWEFLREGTPSQPIYSSDDPFQIQDLIFLENRDRKYDSDIYMLRGVYNLQDIDFNLSQFGLFLQNDTIFITFHINDTVEKLGRKIISGDVIELPHLKDEHALNDLTFALKRFYVIEEVNRAAEGFSVTWYPHLYRAKCKPLVDSQEFKDILDGIADSDNYKGPWEGDVTYFPGDVVKGPDGQNYTCIDPVGVPYDPDTIYYPGDIVVMPDGTKYIVVDPNVLPWNGNTVYNPGDTFTGPDGKIYQVKDVPETQDGISGELAPNADLYEPIQGTGVTGVDPADSDRYDVINVPLNGVTNVFPPSSNYWQLADTLRDIVSTYDKEMQITAGILNQAEADAPRSGWDTSKFYTIQKDTNGRVELVTADNADLDTSVQTQATDESGNLLFDNEGRPIYVGATASTQFRPAEYSDYDGQWLVGDGQPPNGAPFSSGIAFPVNAVDGQYCLRTDYMPNRLFRFNGSRWVKMEDNVRMTMSNMGFKEVAPGGSPNDIFLGKEVRQTQKGTFINNDTVSRIDGRSVKEKQALSKALRPKADE